MTFNIPIKIFIAFFFFCLIFLWLFFKSMNNVERRITNKANVTVAKGVLISLENKLAKMPRELWPKELAKAGTKYLKIVSVDDLVISAQKMKKLKEGKIVFQTGKTYQFLNLGFVSHYGYKKITDTSWVISYHYSSPIQYLQRYMSPAINLIVTELKSNPQSAWPELSQRLEDTYGFAIKIYTKDDASLPNLIKNSLSINHFAYEADKNTLRITTIYYPFDGGIVKIGPLSYLAITGRISDFLFYFVVSFFSLAILIIIFLTAVFIKNMQKVYTITDNFSRGDFYHQKKVRSTSVLYGLYVNVITMGERIKELIDSHKKMCRFIAHEIRTPLSTIQMTADSIKRKSKYENSMDEKVNSIEEDVIAIDGIVSTFLIYSKFQSSEIKLKKTCVDLITWLNKTIESFENSAIRISLNCGQLDSLFAEIDPIILNHAVTNLITNALKFANKDVLVTIFCQGEDFFIHVDDDGAGLSDVEVAEIFSEYCVAMDNEVGNKHIGLGLAIVAKAVSLHNGAVSAGPSPLLTGARFSIKIAL